MPGSAPSSGDAKKFHGALVLKRPSPEHRLTFRMCCSGREARYRTARMLSVERSVHQRTECEAHAHTYACAGKCLGSLVAGCFWEGRFVSSRHPSLSSMVSCDYWLTSLLSFSPTSMRLPPNSGVSSNRNRAGYVLDASGFCVSFSLNEHRVQRWEGALLLAVCHFV